MDSEQIEKTFLEFLRNRRNLNDRLDAVQREIEQWFAAQPMPPALRALAYLEAHLQQRRDLLQQMGELYDGLLSDLARVREGCEQEETRP